MRVAPASSPSTAWSSRGPAQPLPGRFWSSLISVPSRRRRGRASPSAPCSSPSSFSALAVCTTGLVRAVTPASVFVFVGGGAAPGDGPARRGRQRRSSVCAWGPCRRRLARGRRSVRCRSAAPFDGDARRGRARPGLPPAPGLAGRARLACARPFDHARGRGDPGQSPRHAGRDRGVRPAGRPRRAAPGGRPRAAEDAPSSAST